MVFTFQRIPPGFGRPPGSNEEGGVSTSKATFFTELLHSESLCFFDPYLTRKFKGFPGGSDGKASVYNAGDLGSIPGLGRSPGKANSNPLQYYCLENPMDGGAS